MRNRLIHACFEVAIDVVRDTVEKDLPVLIAELNRQLKGWANYFSFGYPRMAYREINWYVQQRLVNHLHRRSQRPYRPPAGVSLYRHMQQLGLEYL